jgi:hypothetical protein
MNGKEKAAEVMKNYKLGDKTTFLNMEAIESIPDEFDVIVTEVKFDPRNLDKSFTNVGTKDNPSWYPSTELMYEIAHARGVEGTGLSITEYRKEEVDINDMLRKPLEAEPTMRIMEVAVKVTKQSTVLEPDGTYRPSSPCSNEFNYWDRAKIDWLNEEKYSDGYTKKGKYDFRYDTALKRKSRYYELKKFALANSETKAFCKTVRELAGLPTGFKTEDLQSGKFVFYKIIRSRMILKMETAARIDAIRRGNTKEIEASGGNVYSDFQIEAPQVEPDIIQEPEPEQEVFGAEAPPTELSFADKSETEKREFLKKILESYLTGPNLTILENIQGAVPVIKSTIKDYMKSDINGIIDIVGKIESKQGIIKIDHDIFGGAK